MSRDTLDRYYTQQALADAAVRRVVHSIGPLSADDAILEPHSGHGAFVRALRSLCQTVIVDTCDVDPEAFQGDDHHVGLFEEWQPAKRYDLIIGNPPFSDATRQIDHALSLLTPTGTLAFLLPLQFWGSVERSGWWPTHMPSQVNVVRPRPSFSGTGSDFREIALWVWCAEDRNCRRLRPTMDHLDWDKPRAKRPSKAAEGALFQEAAE